MKNRALTLTASLGAAMALTMSAAIADPGGARLVADGTNPGPNCDATKAHNFTDVGDSNVHNDSVKCVKEHGITTGKTATTYQPAGYLTKGQLASFLVRTVEAAAASGTAGTGWDSWAGWVDEDYFSDDDGSVHEDNINKLAHAGVIDGAPETFGISIIPDRALMSVMTAAALGYYGALPTTYDNLHDCFSDDNGLDAAVEEAINLLGDAGVVTGKGGAIFDPGQNLRRDQMASFLARAFDLAQDDDGDTTPAEGNSAFCTGDPVGA